MLTATPRQLHAQLFPEAIASPLGDLLGCVRRHVHGRRDVQRLKTDAHQCERDLITLRQAVNSRRHEFGELAQLCRVGQNLLRVLLDSARVDIAPLKLISEVLTRRS